MYATCIKYTSTYEKRGSKGFERCVVKQKMFNIVLMNFFTHHKFSNMILLDDSILYLDIGICFVIIYEEFPKRKTNLNKQLIRSNVKHLFICTLQLKGYIFSNLNSHTFLPSTYSYFHKNVIFNIYT